MNTNTAPKINLTTTERERVLQLRAFRDEARSYSEWDRRNTKYDAYLVRLMDKGVDPSAIANL